MKLANLGSQVAGLASGLAKNLGISNTTSPGYAPPPPEATAKTPPEPPPTTFPSRAITGPFLRLSNYDPARKLYTASVLVVLHPALTGVPPQLQFGVSDNKLVTVPGLMLDTFGGYQFWRFTLELYLTDAPQRFQYYVRAGSTSTRVYYFYVPGSEQPWRWMFYSCNGFHDHEVEKKYKGIQPLWKDALQRHRQDPYHVGVGGGDQLYNDDVWNLPAAQRWLAVPDTSGKSGGHTRANLPMEADLLWEVESYYFSHYASHFSELLYEEFLASVPQVMVWDDHDIFDGWGSYPEFVQRCPVYVGVYKVARRFYLLFQHHANDETAATHAHLWGQGGFNVLTNFGPSTALLALDTRSERTRRQVLSPETWKIVFERVKALPPTTRHLVVVLTVPIVYPKIPFTEDILLRVGRVDRSGALWALMQKSGMGESLMSHFDEPEILDDLLDHWTSEYHTEERKYFVTTLQGIAASKRMRVTFISGDVHCAAFGRFYTFPKVKDLTKDHKFMTQVVCSAVGNEPPPAGLLSVMQATNVSADPFPGTREKMLHNVFPNDAKLLGRRNYCEVTEARYDPSIRGREENGALTFTLRCEDPSVAAIQRVDVYGVTVPVLEA